MVHVDAAVVSLLADRLCLQEMGLEASPKVVGAVKCVDDGANQQHNSQYCKCRQTLADWHILLGSLVDTEKFEDKVCQAPKVEDHNTL